MKALISFTMSATLDNQGVQPVTALARLAWLLSTGGNEITMTWSPKDSGEDEGGEVGRCHDDDDGHCTTSGHSTCAALAWLGPGCHHRPPGQLRDHKRDTGDLF